MIVRDEAQVIGRCLASVRDLIDSYVICDTGSVDGTPELIRQALEGVPGIVHEHEWVDFGHNRTELMRLARGTADYLLLLDADHTVTLDGELPQLTADAYMVLHEGDPAYRIKRLVRGDWEWYFTGATHEVIDTDMAERVEHLDALRIVHHADGGARADKFERDERLLEAELERDPSNRRSTFYLAQTKRDLGKTAEAIELYRRRAEMGGWEEEAFYARFQEGVLRELAGDWPGALATLTAAWSMRPQRLEPLYQIARGLRQREQYAAAHLWAARGLRQPPPAGDILFLHPWVYRWGVLFEYSIAAYWVGEVSAALRACDRLLELGDLPEEHRRHTERNRAFCVTALRRR